MSRLELMQARFQQKQLQEKEQKLLQLYDQQRLRAHQVAQRGSANNNNNNNNGQTNVATHKARATQDAGAAAPNRRQPKGIDKSYPLEPLRKPSIPTRTTANTKQPKPESISRVNGLHYEVNIDDVIDDEAMQRNRIVAKSFQPRKASLTRKPNAATSPRQSSSSSFMRVTESSSLKMKQKIKRSKDKLKLKKSSKPRSTRCCHRERHISDDYDPFKSTSLVSEVIRNNSLKSDKVDEVDPCTGDNEKLGKVKTIVMKIENITSGLRASAKILFKLKKRAEEKKRLEEIEARKIQEVVDSGEIKDQEKLKDPEEKIKDRKDREKSKDPEDNKIQDGKDKEKSKDPEDKKIQDPKDRERLKDPEEKIKDRKDREKSKDPEDKKIQDPKDREKLKDPEEKIKDRKDREKSKDPEEKIKDRKDREKSKDPEEKIKDRKDREKSKDPEDKKIRDPKSREKSKDPEDKKIQDRKSREKSKDPEDKKIIDRKDREKSKDPEDKKIQEKSKDPELFNQPRRPSADELRRESFELKRQMFEQILAENRRRDSVESALRYFDSISIEEIPAEDINSSDPENNYSTPCKKKKSRGFEKSTASWDMHVQPAARVKKSQSLRTINAGGKQQSQRSRSPASPGSSEREAGSRQKSSSMKFLSRIVGSNGDFEFTSENGYASAPRKSSMPADLSEQQKTGVLTSTVGRNLTASSPGAGSVRGGVAPGSRFGGAPKGRPPGKTSPGADSTDNSNLACCKICNRRFANDRISLHEQICAKTAQKKRKQFDVVTHRVKGTELESFVTKPFGKKSIAKPTKVESEPKVPKSNWRRKHEDFINAIRSAKQMQTYLASGGKLSDLPPPPPSDTSDYVQCPHCSRKFSQGAAERHIPKCGSMQHNKPRPPAGRTKR